jgi:glycosyltransferase involved in cell wall biosynthesis
VDEFKVDKPYQESNGLIVKNWPTRRATKWKDAVYLAKLINAEKPDALIGNFGSVNIMMLVGWLMGVKNRIAWYATVSKAQALNFRGKKLLFKLLLLRKKWVYKHATGIVAVSEEAAKDFIKTYKSGRDVISIPRLIHDPESMAGNRKPQKQEPYITLIGRLVASKDQFTAIRAMKHIIPYYPKLKLKLIGDGPIKNELLEYARQLGIASNCEFTGHLYLASVFAALKNSKLNLCTSIDDALPMVNIQALGMGVPLIGTNAGGIKNIVKEGYNGFLFKVRDDSSLADKVLKLLKDRKLHEELAKNARNDFKSNYLLNEQNIDSQAKKLLKFFK